MNDLNIVRTARGYLGCSWCARDGKDESATSSVRARESMGSLVGACDTHLAALDTYRDDFGTTHER